MSEVGGVTDPVQRTENFSLGKVALGETVFQSKSTCGSIRVNTRLLRSRSSKYSPNKPAMRLPATYWRLVLSGIVRQSGAFDPNSAARWRSTYALGFVLAGSTLGILEPRPWSRVTIV